MAITRIAFNTFASYTGAFHLSLNPSSLEANSSDNYGILEALDGPRVKQDTNFDSRPITMQWVGIPTDFPGFQSMLGTLQTYKNKLRYVNFGTVDYGVPTLGWTLVRIEDVKVSVGSGGLLRYFAEVILNPE